MEYKEYKEYLFKKFSKGNYFNTGSIEFQIFLFSYRIKYLTNHLKFNRKDYSSRLSLIKIVNKQRKALYYLKNKSIKRYNTILSTLNLKK